MPLTSWTSYSKGELKMELELECDAIERNTILQKNVFCTLKKVGSLGKDSSVTIGIETETPQSNQGKLLHFNPNSFANLFGVSRALKESGHAMGDTRGILEKILEKATLTITKMNDDGSGTIKITI